MRTAESGFRTWLLAATCLTAMAPGLSHAQTTPAPTPAPAAPAAEAPPPGYWINGIHLSAVIEAGILANPADPKLNIGQSFTDHPNQVQLNQVLIGAEKKLDPKATGFDWGFKLSLMYGSDARYTHYLGLLDQALPVDQRNQFDIVEASGILHFPVSFLEGGLDVKGGLYASPLGAELIDPSTNPFYSHSYIFYALPFKHTGAYATAHVTGLLDLYFGVDTGVNTTFGAWGENNDNPAYLVGFGLNMLDGNLTVVALSHIGPENATRALSPAGFNADGYMRYYNDVVVVWKATDKLTITGEGTWIRDDFGVPGSTATSREAANAFGVALYGSYTLTDTVTLNGRAEVFRDDNGFFVGAFEGNYDPVRVQRGQTLLSTAYFPGQATYGEITLGVTWKPDMPAPITGLMIRPEIRYDQSLGGKKVFNPTSPTTFKDSGQFTVGTDVVLTF